MLQLTVDPARGDRAVFFGGEQEAAVFSALPAPFQSFLTEGIRDIDPADFSALGIQVQMTAGEMLYLDLGQFTDADSCGNQETDNKIPEVLSILFQTFLKKEAVLVGDHVIEKGTAGNLDGRKPEFPQFRVHFVMAVFQKQEEVVHGMDPLIDGGGQMILLKQADKFMEIFDRRLIEETVENACTQGVGNDRVQSQALFL